MKRLLPLAFVAVLLAPAPASERAPDRRLNVAFLIWDGMELIESMGPAHVFAFAPGMDAYTVGRTRDPIRSEFVTIVPEYSLADCPEPDVIVIPGGAIWTPMTDGAFRTWLLEHVPRARLTLSVCNGAILLADLGLLNGKEATCGDSNLDDIMLLGENVRGYANRRWVHSGNVITSKSYLAGIDAAIYAVRVLRGEKGERQVLDWSNYDGDPTKYDAMQAEPGIVPVSRRREIVEILMRDGVDAAVERFAEWERSGKPAYTPPLDRFREQDLFQWMAWGNQRLGRNDVSLRICEFKSRVWPDSARERAYFGEALYKAGRVEDALRVLLEANELEPGNGQALGFMRNLLHDARCVPSRKTDETREVLRRYATARRAELVNDGEPGVPLVLEGRVLDSSGDPVAGALVHAFQADAAGRYTPHAAMDESNARLFVFVKTDADGRFELVTVRPGVYPQPADATGDARFLPGHVHFVVAAPGFEEESFRVFFSDDPRTTEYRSARAEHDDNPVADVRRLDDGTQSATVDIVLRGFGSGG